MTLTNQEIARLDEVLKTSAEFVIDKELSETALQILTEKICKDIACSEHQFSFKDLSQDKKITMFKVLLEQATCYNKQLLVNLVNLLKAYNQFSDDFFKNSVIVFSNIEEFLDIKLALEEQIQKFLDSFASYYLSMFVSMHKDVKNYLEAYIQAPHIFVTLIQSLDLYTLSGICQKAKAENVKIFAKPIFNAKEIISTTIDKWKVSNAMLKAMLPQFAT